MKWAEPEIEKKADEMLAELRLAYGLKGMGYYLWGETPKHLERALYGMLSELPDEEDQAAFAEVAPAIVQRIRENGEGGIVFGKGHPNCKESSDPSEFSDSTILA